MGMTLPITGYENFDHLVAALVETWPQHAKFMRRNISERSETDLRFSEFLSTIILSIARSKQGGLTTLIDDYRFLCERIVMPEELHFRRTGGYRLNSFEEAYRLVYSDSVFMTKYMNGLLFSDVIWVNHCRSMMNYTSSYLAGLSSGSRMLEIGPGHGLLLHLATLQEKVGHLTAWDISDASLVLASSTLEILGSRKKVEFERRNIFSDDVMSSSFADKFDGIVLSEVLEHLEDPLRALKVLHHLTRPGGTVWINVPSNSPAPDHLYLVEEAADVERLLEYAGFEIRDSVTYPTTGATVESAKMNKLTSNCVITALKP